MKRVLASESADDALELKKKMYCTPLAESGHKMF